MATQTLDNFLSKELAKAFPKGPVALIYVEDDIGVGSTIRHHKRIGFENILVLASQDVVLPDDCKAACVVVNNDPDAGLSIDAAVNKLIVALPERWIYYCYNAEYLHFPFCEDRNVIDLITFISEERRGSALAYIIDLYADDLEQHPMGYSLEAAHLDSSGYYALPRQRDGEIMLHQLDIFGGLKWRFEEHFPPTKRRIDRTGLFKAQKGLQLNADMLFNDEDLNTYQCPWHNSATVAICSFRTAKYLKSNPGSTYEVSTFRWGKSEQFHWNSQQLMDLGLMEPGQWF